MRGSVVFHRALDQEIFKHMLKNLIKQNMSSLRGSGVNRLRCRRFPISLVDNLSNQYKFKVIVIIISLILEEMGMMGIRDRLEVLEEAQETSEEVSGPQVGIQDLGQEALEDQVVQEEAQDGQEAREIQQTAEDQEALVVDHLRLRPHHKVEGARLEQPTAERTRVSWLILPS